MADGRRNTGEFDAVTGEHARPQQQANDDKRLRNTSIVVALVLAVGGATWTVTSWFHNVQTKEEAKIQHRAIYDHVAEREAASMSTGRSEVRAIEKRLDDKVDAKFDSVQKDVGYIRGSVDEINRKLERELRHRR